jgi:SAM-dependent methyltransferase
LGVVGHRALGREYNAYIYRRRAEAIDGWLSASPINSRTARVLDVGAGSGFYLDYWRRHGVADVTGVDVSPDAVTGLAARFPEYRMLCADVTIPEAFNSVQGQFDLITLFDVLYHITRDAEAEAALRVLSSRLAPNGRLLVFDHVMRRDYSLRRHVRFRGEASYARMLRAAQLEIVERIPLFAVLEPPLFGVAPVDIVVSGAYRAAGLLWRAIPQLGKIAGAATFHMDALLRRSGVIPPNHELLVMRRVAAGS